MPPSVGGDKLGTLEALVKVVCVAVFGCEFCLYISSVFSVVLFHAVCYFQGYVYKYQNFVSYPLLRMQETSEMSLNNQTVNEKILTLHTANEKRVKICKQNWQQNLTT